MEHLRDMKHEIEKKRDAKEWLQWMKGEIAGIRERAGKQCIQNKKRKTAGEGMLEQRVKKGKRVENENVLDGYIGKQKERKMTGRRESGRGVYVFYGGRLLCLCGWISSLSPSVSMAAPSC